MTMQVGMVGSDGLVLASDTRWYRPPIMAGGAAWQTYSSSKIKINETRKIAVTCARDMTTATRVAEAIFSSFAGIDHKDCAEDIKRIGSGAASGHDIECLVGFADDDPSLYIFQYANHGSDVSCLKILDHAFAGDTMNAAIFWAMRYYERTQIKRLIPLAGHLIFTAGKLNSAMIGGLELVYTDHDGFHRFTDTQNRELMANADEWDTKIGTLINGLSPLT